MQEDIITKLVRWMLALILTIGFLFFGGFFIYLMKEAIVHKTFPSSAIAPTTIFLFLTFASGLTAWKCWRIHISNNDTPAFPRWFISLFGIFLIGMIYLMCKNHDKNLIPIAADLMIITMGLIMWNRRKRN